MAQATNGHGYIAERSPITAELMRTRRTSTSANYERIEKFAGRDARALISSAVSDFDSSKNAHVVVKAFADLAERLRDPIAVQGAALRLAFIMDMAENGSEKKAVKFVSGLKDVNTSEQLPEHVQALISELREEA